MQHFKFMIMPWARSPLVVLKPSCSMNDRLTFFVSYSALAYALWRLPMYCWTYIVLLFQAREFLHFVSVNTRRGMLFTTSFVMDEDLQSLLKRLALVGRGPHTRLLG
jgi:hypothetical protein